MENLIKSTDVKDVMADNPNQPRENDAVLGGQTLLPVNSGIWGGLEAVKSRLAGALEEQRIAALSEALKYGEVGLDLVFGLCKINQSR